VVRHTLTHEALPADQADGTNKGWALVLSSLKSLLETGRGEPHVRDFRKQSGAPLTEA
jgi:hypothetical protein